MSEDSIQGGGTLSHRQQGQDQGLGPLIAEEALEAEEAKTVTRVKTAGPAEAVGAARGRLG